METLEAIDSVCDQKGDKGVDGIYVNESNGTIDIFQSKISQKADRTIGDSILKEFYGTLAQFESRETIDNLIATAGGAQIVSLIKRLSLDKIIEQYKVRGIFISNIEIDHNGLAYLNQTPNIEYIGANILRDTFISTTKSIPEDSVATFDVFGYDVSKHIVDAETSSFMAPIKATELVKMTGIADQSVFALNVRGPLGNTNVNRDIIRSIKDKSLHKKFPLFHNGITILAQEISDEEEAKLTIKSFFVVNGCQSLTTLYNYRTDLTDDLRILVKFVQVPLDSELSKIITHYSNNQNGVKPRDFKSNNNIQVRLQNEFKEYYGSEFFFEIKRGEINTGVPLISNERAGILLMSFDVKEPWGTHRKYQVFDDKYNDVFGRPEVTAHRILMLYILDEIISSKLPQITNKLVSKYALTRYTILYIVRQILENDNKGKELLSKPEGFVYRIDKRKQFIEAASTIIDDIIIDFNGEVESLGEDFDYKSRLRDEVWIKNLSKDIVSSYLKQVSRKRIESFEDDWNSRLKINKSQGLFD